MPQMPQRWTRRSSAATSVALLLLAAGSWAPQVAGAQALPPYRPPYGAAPAPTPVARRRAPVARAVPARPPVARAPARVTLPRTGTGPVLGVPAGVAALALAGGGAWLLRRRPGRRPGA